MIEYCSGGRYVDAIHYEHIHVSVTFSLNAYSSDWRWTMMKCTIYWVCWLRFTLLLGHDKMSSSHTRNCHVTPRQQLAYHYYTNLHYY